ncbi:MAG: polysaccharide deacetylase [Caulobacterales bacterium]
MTTVCLSFDFDAMANWISGHKLTTPTPLSRGEYGARVGVGRILDLLAANQVTATFFVPGHTAVTFPAEVKAIHRAGHEIAAHGFSHATPVSMGLDGEIADFDAAERALGELLGLKPAGYRSPAWDLSADTLGLLQERGYLYDSSLMADDFTPYHPRLGDRVDADGTVHFGAPARLVELPVSWELDDYVHFQYVARALPGLKSADDVEKLWLAEFDYCARRVASGVFTLTMHPQVIGRGPRIVMLDRLIKAMKAYPDVTFRRMEDVAREFLATSGQG